jgi:hypothetical protein
VHIITTEEERLRGLRMGAIGALTKPLKSKEVLQEVFARIRDAIIKPHADPAGDEQRTSPAQCNHGTGAGEGIQIESGAGTGQEALAKLRDNHFDAVVLIGLAGCGGL